MAVVLGKDCAIAFGNADPDTVRSVSWSQSAKEIEVHPFGQRAVCKWACGYEASVDVEFVDDPAVNAALISGEPITISGSGYSGNFVVTSIVRSEPLDDVVTVKVTAKLAVA